LPRAAIKAKSQLATVSVANVASFDSNSFRGLSDKHLNMLSSLRNRVSDKKIKVTHATTESTVDEMRGGHKLNKSRSPNALTDAGSSGCIILNELTKGINHKRCEDPQQWVIKGAPQKLP
jgi:hypothetical protein